MKLETKAEIERASYVQIPGTNKLIVKYEEDRFKSFNYDTTHFEINEKGLFMPIPALFMPYFVNIIQAYRGEIELYDGLGNRLDKKEKEDIYKHYTTNHINHGAWTWLNAKFVKGKGFHNLDLKTVIDIKDNQLITKTEPLEECIWEDCYVELEFNKQGFALRKSRIQEYKQGENIEYWHPRENYVVRFYASPVRSYLDCTGNPQDSNSELGVAACAEAVFPRVHKKGVRRR